MRKPLAVLAVLAFVALPVLGASVRDPRPGVPRQAVEASTLAPDGFGDGPTPFPIPKPPSPRPTPAIGMDEAIYAYARGATWYTRRPDGGLRWHGGCGDVGRIGAELAAAPSDRVSLVVSLYDSHSADMETALSPWRAVFAATILQDEPAGDVNARWWGFVRDHAEEIAAGVSLSDAGAGAGTCTTGRCDCCDTQACCDTAHGHACSCQTYNAAVGDCQQTRASCNVDDGPEPGRGPRTATPTWGY